MSTFPCTQCGRCCEHVNLALETRFLDRGDGACRHYNSNTRLCSVYTTRPDICRVGLQYKTHYQDLCSWDDFVKLNLEVCQQLQEQPAKHTQDGTADRIALTPV